MPSWTLKTWYSILLACGNQNECLCGEPTQCYLREKGFVNLREIHNADNNFVDTCSYHSVMSYSFSLKLPLCISYTIGILQTYEPLLV